MVFLWVLLFSTLASVGSILAASATLAINDVKRTKIIPLLVAYATGALLSSATVGLIPEALENNTVTSFEPLFIAFLTGIIIFFLLEKVIIWHHCHEEDCEERKKMGSLILVGDGVHNIVDGILIAASFLTSIELGIAVSVSAIIHEVAQEIGDFAILLNSGYSRKRAFTSNLLSSLSMVVAALIAFFALETVQSAVPYIIMISAASFIYIALADLSPELHHHKRDAKLVIRQLLFIAIGIVTVLSILTIHQH